MDLRDDTAQSPRSLFEEGYRQGLAAKEAREPQGYTPGYAPPPWRRERTEQPHRGTVIAGWWCAFLLPFVGFILGIIVATRPDPAVNHHGWKLMVVSSVWWIACIVITVAIAAAANHSTGPTY
jgi:hypothetical protein